MRWCVLVAVLCAFALGCGGGPEFVPVSGVVTLNGKPYGKAAVSFQPIGTTENPNPGRGSSAYTDENGRFRLMMTTPGDGVFWVLPGNRWDGTRKRRIISARGC